jgi:predicted SAM-dependent methyltransferase
MASETVPPPLQDAYTLPPGLLVHVGCGPVTPDGWVNLDGSWNLLAARIPGMRRVLRAVGVISAEAAEQPWVGDIRYCDVSRGLPFRDGEAAVVYASHVLEHLTRRQAHNLVRESFRVLKPGGVVRIVVPDLERLAHLYLQERANGAGDGRAANDFMEHLRTCLDDADASLPLKLYRAYLDTLSHKWMYDTASLTALMAEAGFSELSQRACLESRIPLIAQVERAGRFEDGICVEGVR